MTSKVTREIYQRILAVFKLLNPKRVVHLRTMDTMQEVSKLEIWPQRPGYFAASPCTTTLVRGGWYIPWGGGLTLDLTWLMAGRGWHPWGGGGKQNQRLCCSQNHWSSNTS